MLNDLKIFFFGTPQIGADILATLLSVGVKIDTVITRPDKPKGRGGKISESPVKAVAIKENIKVVQPLKKAELETFITNEKPDLIIVAAFGMILPKGVIESPKFKAINVHPSLLPLYRGPAPIEYPILNGDNKTGVTIMLMNEGMDEGDILAQKEISLLGTETAPDLEKKLADLGSSLLIDTLPKWIAGEISPKKQNDDLATYSRMITKEDGHIIFSDESACEIERKNRAFSPWPGTYTFWDNKKIDLYEIQENTEEIEPGKIVAHDGNIIIGTRKGSVSIKELKIEGKNRVPAADFLRGYQDFINTKLA